MSKKDIEQLRALVLSERRAKRGPFSTTLRERLNTFLKARAREGESLKSVGEQLGLSNATVQYWKARWSERAERAPKLRRVTVVAEKSPSEKEVTMHGPAGTRVEDLTLDEVASLWRKLS